MPTSNQIFFWVPIHLHQSFLIIILQSHLTTKKIVFLVFHVRPVSCAHGCGVSVVRAIIMLDICDILVEILGCTLAKYCFLWNHQTASTVGEIDRDKHCRP